jgi:hypothetical protein
VGQAVAEAQHARELSKQALEAQVGTLEARVRRELDWRAKLRQHGPRYAVIAVATVSVVAGVIVLRIKFGRKDEKVQVRVSTMDDIARQLTEIRQELDKRRKENGPLWHKLGLRVATAAAAAGGTLVARQLMERFAPEAAATSADDRDPFKEAGKAARAASL